MVLLTNLTILPSFDQAKKDKYKQNLKKITWRIGENKLEKRSQDLNELLVRKVRRQFFMEKFLVLAAAKTLPSSSPQKVPLLFKTFTENWDSKCHRLELSWPI